MTSTKRSKHVSAWQNLDYICMSILVHTSFKLTGFTIFPLDFSLGWCVNVKTVSNILMATAHPPVEHHSFLENISDRMECPWCHYAHQARLLCLEGSRIGRNQCESAWDWDEFGIYCQNKVCSLVALVGEIPIACSKNISLQDVVVNWVHQELQAVHYSCRPPSVPLSWYQIGTRQGPLSERSERRLFSGGLLQTEWPQYSDFPSDLKIVAMREACENHRGMFLSIRRRSGQCAEPCLVRTVREIEEGHNILEETAFRWTQRAAGTLYTPQRWIISKSEFVK